MCSNSNQKSAFFITVFSETLKETDHGSPFQAISFIYWCLTLRVFFFLLNVPVCSHLTDLNWFPETILLYNLCEIIPANRWGHPVRGPFSSQLAKSIAASQTTCQTILHCKALLYSLPMGMWGSRDEGLSVSSSKWHCTIVGSIQYTLGTQEIFIV